MPAPPKQRKIAIVGSRSVGQSLTHLQHASFTHVDGDGDAGKSSLTVQFVDGHFVESYYPTIENTFSKVIKYKGQEYATEIIDTAGQVCHPSILICSLSCSSRVPPSHLLLHHHHHHPRTHHCISILCALLWI